MNWSAAAGAAMTWAHSRLWINREKEYGRISPSLSRLYHSTTLLPVPKAVNPVRRLSIEPTVASSPRSESHCMLYVVKLETGSVLALASSSCCVLCAWHSCEVLINVVLRNTVIKHPWCHSSTVAG